MKSVLGPSRYWSCGVQEGSKEDGGGCLTLRQGGFSQASGVNSHLVLGMLEVHRRVRAEDQGEDQVSSFGLKFHPPVAPALGWVENLGLLWGGAEGREVEPGVWGERKRRRGQMQIRAWPVFPGKWLCMLSHPWPE